MQPNPNTHAPHPRPCHVEVRPIGLAPMILMVLMAVGGAETSAGSRARRRCVATRRGDTRREKA